MKSQTVQLQTGCIYSIISAICFGFLAIFFKLGYQQDLTTGVMLFFRFVLGFIFLTPYVFLTKYGQLKLSWRAVTMACICGVFFYGLQSYFFAASLKFISASTSSLILYLYPLMVMLLARFFFKSRITADKIISLVLIIGGCIMVYYDAFSRQMDGTGLLLATLAMLTFSAYIVFLQKSLVNVDSTVFSYYVIGFTALQCAVTYHPFSAMSLNGSQWLICILLALVPTVFAIILLYKAIERIGSSYTAIFCSIEPAVTILVSAILLHEAVKLPQIIGMFCIIAGIAVPNFLAAQKRSR